ncbi:MAG: hypothetical protein ACK2TV_01775, partial [Anaerolineales bacterium]
MSAWIRSIMLTGSGCGAFGDNLFQGQTRKGLGVLDITPVGIQALVGVDLPRIVKHPGHDLGGGGLAG